MNMNVENVVLNTIKVNSTYFKDAEDFNASKSNHKFAYAFTMETDRKELNPTMFNGIIFSDEHIDFYNIDNVYEMILKNKKEQTQCFHFISSNFSEESKKYFLIEELDKNAILNINIEDVSNIKIEEINFKLDVFKVKCDYDNHEILSEIASILLDTNAKMNNYDLTKNYFVSSSNFLKLIISKEREKVIALCHYDSELGVSDFDFSSIEEENKFKEIALKNHSKESKKRIMTLIRNYGLKDSFFK